MNICANICNIAKNSGYSELRKDQSTSTAKFIYKQKAKDKSILIHASLLYRAPIESVVDLLEHIAFLLGFFEISKLSSSPLLVI